MADLAAERTTSRKLVEACLSRIAHPDGEGKRVFVKVYDVAGRRIRTLLRGSQAAGQHEVTWDGRGDRGTLLMNGVYFVRFTSGGEQREMRVIYMR